jgi:hypothetical protein
MKNNNFSHLKILGEVVVQTSGVGENRCRGGAGAGVFHRLGGGDLR